MPVRLHLDDIGHVAADSIVVDTNVLLNTFAVNASHPERHKREYGRALSLARGAGKRLYVDFVILSEFINTELRTAFALFRDAQRDEHLEFKRDYRSTIEYRSTLATTMDIVRTQILRLCQVTNHQYSRSELVSRAGAAESGSSDWNDLHIAELARDLSGFVLTDDADFIQIDVDTISANPRLLT